MAIPLGSAVLSDCADPNSPVSFYGSVVQGAVWGLRTSLSVYSLGVFADSGISEVAQLRLVNSSSRCAGRVEVLHNQEWGTVCDDSWDLQDAGVVCRQLGCGTALLAPGGAQFGRGSDRIWLDDVNCAGTEAALFDCRARPWGDNNCNHGEDAGVDVYSFGVFADSGISEPAQLRLVNGPSHCAGRVEVLHNQQWGTVCDDGWDITDAGVVCRQLGCGTALSAPGGARFGRGSDPIWLDDVNCTGTEAALSDCRARPWEDNNCNHGEDAGVVCSGNSHLPPYAGSSEVAQLRLVNSPSRCAGRVEVLHNQQWGTVCDDNWDLQDAGVICRQLGCGTALSSPGGARFGQGSDHIWLDDVHCTGTEVALSDCRARPWGENNCNHRKDAGVVCSAASWELLSPLLFLCRYRPFSLPEAVCLRRLVLRVLCLCKFLGPHWAEAVNTACLYSCALFYVLIGSAEGIAMAQVTSFTSTLLERHMLHFTSLFNFVPYKHLAPIRLTSGLLALGRELIYHLWCAIVHIAS
uniref:Soluble scavenger receptor cysteine-rich domain-containing protein SSC5D n=1 Tax=Terrapene triunguis TaxID=2587831 RepID=A0A674J490_9SAUR